MTAEDKQQRYDEILRSIARRRPFGSAKSLDGDSLTIALALYERMGMRVHHSFDSNEMLPRDGVALAQVEPE